MLETGINGYLQELIDNIQLFNTDGLPNAAISTLLARALEEQAQGTVKRATWMKIETAPDTYLRRKPLGRKT